MRLWLHMQTVQSFAHNLAYMPTAYTHRVKARTQPCRMACARHAVAVHVTPSVTSIHAYYTKQILTSLSQTASSDLTTRVCIVKHTA
jgi:adenylate cyclase